MAKKEYRVGTEGEHTPATVNMPVRGRKAREMFYLPRVMPDRSKDHAGGRLYDPERLRREKYRDEMTG